MTARASLAQLFNPAMISSTLLGLGIGQILANGATTTSSETVTLNISAPSWVVAGMPIYNITAGGYVGDVGSVSTVTVTLAANSATAIASGDLLQFGFNPADVQAGFSAASGADVRGILQSVYESINDAVAKLNFLTTDIITNSEDSHAYTILAAALAFL